MDETAGRDDRNALWFATPSRERVLQALAEDARREGFQPVALDELAPYGRWLHDEEDPTVRRHAVAPPHGGWVGVFPSQPDWDHERAPAIAEILGTRACCLMLHDGDVLTLHAHDGPRLLASYCSSPVHFDLEPPADGRPELDASTLAALCRPGTTPEQVVRALTPPGRIDVDGRRALDAISELLGLGPAAATTYADLLAGDRLHLRAEFASFVHVAHRLEETDDEAEDERGPGGRLLRFPRPPAPPT